MTEDLLALMTIIAIWKVVQVRMMKRKLKRLQSETQAMIRRAIEDANKLKERVDAVCQDEVIGDLVEWPEEIG